MGEAEMGAKGTSPKLGTSAPCFPLEPALECSLHDSVPVIQ